jgi:hypothetical protein
MLENFCRDAAVVVGLAHLAGPLVLRCTFRFTSRCQLTQVSTEELPVAVATAISSRIPDLQDSGFELLGCYDCGELAAYTHSYLGYFCNRASNDFASISIMLSARGMDCFLEFSSTFADGRTFETNTNGMLPITPADSQRRIFRFPEIADVRALYNIHRLLIEKYAPGLWPQGEPKGHEIQRFLRAVENYGPRHAKLGYLQPTSDGASYRATWKGAFLMTWNGLWPNSLIRKAAYKQAMRAELHSLQVLGETALQKA